MPSELALCPRVFSYNALHACLSQKFKSSFPFVHVHGIQFLTGGGFGGCQCEICFMV